MSGIDMFVAVLCGIMFFGGLYLNIISRKLSSEYFDAHKPEIGTQKTAPSPKPVNKSIK